MSGADVERVPDEASWTPVLLSEVRANARRRAVALALAMVAGLAVAWVHWLGLFVAGALVGLVSRSLPRAVVWGVVVGLLAIVLTALASPMGPVTFVTFRPPVYVTLAAGILAPVWGSLVRLVL